MTTAIKLPPFSLLAKQPKIPHVARTVAQADITNEHGTPITFIVSRSRNGRSWWIRAAREGMRMSNTLHTTVEAKGQAWIAAVKAGTVSVARETSLSCAMGLGECHKPITHIDDKGYVYCTGHGERRRCDGVRKCRALRPGEITKLVLGETIKY